MSNFYCETCGAAVIDSPAGYVEGCEHYPPDVKNNDTKSDMEKKITDFLMFKNRAKYLTPYHFDRNDAKFVITRFLGVAGGIAPVADENRNIIGYIGAFSFDGDDDVMESACEVFDKCHSQQIFETEFDVLICFIGIITEIAEAINEGRESVAIKIAEKHGNT